MRLAAMMGLMQEKIRQQVTDGFVEGAGLPASRRHAPGRVRGTQAVAERDEAPVAFRLCRTEQHHVVDGPVSGECSWPLAATDNRVDVVVIDSQDVVESCVERGKE